MYEEENFIMHKTVITLLLIVAVFCVSCSPESKDTAPAPTAENFLKMYFTCTRANDISSKIEKDLGKDGQNKFTLETIDKEKICSDLTACLTTSSSKNLKKRFCVTSVTEAGGTFISEADVSNISFTFKYYEEAQKTQDGEFVREQGAEEKTGYIRFSYKKTVANSTISVTDFACNFEVATRDAYFNSLPDVSKSDMVKAGDFSVVFKDAEITGLSMNGVALSDEEVKKAAPQMGM